MSERTIFECEAGAVTIEYGKAHFYQSPDGDNIYTTAIEKLEELQAENARLKAIEAQNDKTLDEAFAAWQATDQGKRFSNPEYMGASIIHVQRWWHVLYTVFGYARAEGAALSDIPTGKETTDGH